MDIHKLIGKLPRPEKGFVWPGHKYTGPWNPLSKQLDENDLPIFKVRNLLTKSMKLVLDMIFVIEITPMRRKGVMM